jgi:hypothetical protein
VHVARRGENLRRGKNTLCCGHLLAKCEDPVSGVSSIHNGSTAQLSSNGELLLALYFGTDASKLTDNYLVSKNYCYSVDMKCSGNRLVCPILLVLLRGVWLVRVTNRIDG